MKLLAMEYSYTCAFFFFLSFLLSLRSFIWCVLETRRRCYTYGWQHSVPHIAHFYLVGFCFLSFFVYILLPLNTVFFFYSKRVFFFPSKSLTVFVFLLLFFFFFGVLAFKYVLLFVLLMMLFFDLRKKKKVNTC